MCGENMRRASAVKKGDAGEELVARIKEGAWTFPEPLVLVRLWPEVGQVKFYLGGFPGNRVGMLNVTEHFAPVFAQPYNGAERAMRAVPGWAEEDYIRFLFASFPGLEGIMDWRTI